MVRMSSGTTMVPDEVDVVGTTVGLGVMEDCGSNKLVVGVSPALTSDDESERSEREGGVEFDSLEMFTSSEVGSSIGVVVADNTSRRWSTCLRHHTPESISTRYDTGPRRSLTVPGNQ